MYKKIYLSLFLAVLVSLLVGGVALAQSEQEQARPGGGRRGIGQITAIGSNQFTINTRQGNERIIRIDENTRFRDIEGEEIEFGELEVGDWVAAIVRPDPELGPLARLVILLPEDYDPSQRLGVRLRGLVTAVDPGRSTFTLQARSGLDLTFAVNEHTVFKGIVQSLADLQPGMHAAVAGVKKPDGSLLAHVVLTRQPLVKLAGQITEVDLGESSFTLDTRRGKTVVILVDEHTKFRSRDGEINGLEDLQPGMIAVVAAKKDLAGNLVALGVGVGTKDQLPDFDLRAAGKVIEVSANSFTIQTHNDEQYSLLVTEETRFRSRGGKVNSLEDLQPGMGVGIAAVELEDGSFQAQIVIVGPLRKP